MSQVSDWRILLIDDEPDILDVVGLTLTDVGYTVKTVGDGEAGLTVCADFRPHIVITDIRMPGKDGLQVLAHVKAHFPNTEVIVSTAYGDMTLAVRALQLEASDFITKPIAADGLLVAVKRAKERIQTRKKLRDDQASLLHKNKMMSLGRLSAGVAHEINNPLTTILTSAMLIQEDSNPDDPAYEEMQTIANEALRCRNIVISLLNFARQTQPQKKMNDINQVVTETVLLTQKQADFNDIMVQSELALQIPALMCDKGQIKQALINLILNAVEATDEEGTIVVATSHDAEKHIVLINISDTGRGIDEDKIETIFEPFFSTKESGTGLGLSITHGIIEQHGGTISVKSSLGQGACFTIQLPVTTESHHDEFRTHFRQ